MKKAIALSFTLILAASAAHARAIEGPDAARHAHRQQQIEQRRAEGKTGEVTRPEKPQGEGKWAKFWKNEGERSGLGNSGSRVGNFFTRLNPVPALKDQERRYEERKASASSAK